MVKVVMSDVFVSQKPIEGSMGLGSASKNPLTWMSCIDLRAHEDIRKGKQSIANLNPGTRTARGHSSRALFSHSL